MEICLHLNNDWNVFAYALQSTLLKVVVVHFSVLQIVSWRLVLYYYLASIVNIFDVIDNLSKRMETTEEGGSSTVVEGLK